MEYSVSPNCDVMQTYVNSIELRISLIVNLIIAIIAFPILVKSITYIWKTDTFHRNTKMQIFVHLFALLIHVIGRLGLHSLDLFNYFTLGNSSACEIIPKFYRCLILRAFYNIGLALSSMCSICLVLERYASTIYSSNYEHFGPNYGIALVFVQILLASSFIGSLYFYASFQPGDNVLYYCQTIASSRGNIYFIIIPLYSVLVSQIIARFMFNLLMKRNRKLRSHQTISLSNRFNLDQSIRSINVLTHAINYSTFVFIVLSIVTTTLHFNASHFSKPVYIALVEAVHILPLYSIVVPIMIHKNLSDINKMDKKNLDKAIHAGSDAYFTIFAKQIS